MKQQILDLLNTLSEEEQNILMEEVVKSLKQERMNLIKFSDQRLQIQT